MECGIWKSQHSIFDIRHSACFFSFSMMDLVFFGIQGSGKGTQARKLAQEFGYSIFEAGGELRAIAASGSKLGETVKSYIDVGKLVPHKIIMQVVKEAIGKRQESQKILFDGIPRDRDQQRDFQAIMKKEGRDFRCVHILLNEEDALQRILKRARDQGRTDDANEAIVRKRMATFHEKTEPVIKQYKAEGRMIEIAGEGTVDTLYEKLKEALGLA